MSHPFQYDLSISGLHLQIRSDIPIRASEKFCSFFTAPAAPDVLALIQQTDRLPQLSESVIHEDLCYRVHPDEPNGFLRSFFDAPRDINPYAVSYWDENGSVIHVHYLKRGSCFLSDLGSCFFHIGLEQLLLRKERLPLHAACIRTELGGILFSGPSGIGKSTQADLWCKYRGARQINGDRPILSRVSGEWLAWGSPYAGSSQCHINESCPMQAIIMLHQARECKLRKLTLPQAFRAVWSGLTMHSWDTAQVTAASDLTMELIGEVPVYEFACTPDVHAVEFLKQRLSEELPWKH